MKIIITYLVIGIIMALITLYDNRQVIKDILEQYASVSIKVGVIVGIVVSIAVMWPIMIMSWFV